MTKREMLEDRGRKRKGGGYASKYYDPDKAHEYYMKHRKLKGRKKGRKSGKKSAPKRPKYSQNEKNLLQLAKKNTEENISKLKEIVANWQAKQEELISKSKDSKEKEAIRKKIKAVKAEMNKQIRQAREIYKKYKEAYQRHTIEKFAESQKPKKEGNDKNG